MSFFDRLFGRKQEPVTGPTQRLDQDQLQNPPQNDDERAVERYRYMLRTAPPETIEQAHAEAFAQLTPEQRQMVLQQISSNLPNAERPRQDDPQSLARAATRAEMRQPGTLVQIFQSTPPMGYGMGMGGMGMGGMGMGGMLGGSFLTTMAGAFVGTAIANQFFDNNPMIYNDYGDAGAEAGAGDATDLSTEVDYADPGADAGYNDAGYSDAGFDQGGFGGGDFGGDFGGGDFGGGDFGGGDF